MRGVEPDIVIPSQYEFIDMGEKEQEFVMEWDEIEPASYDIWKPSYNEADIVKNSMMRIEQSAAYQKITENALRLKEQRENTEASLNYDEFTRKQQELDLQEDEFDKVMDEVELGLNVMNLKANLEQINSDTVKTEINERWLEKLQKDLTLDEAVQVIGEMRTRS